MRLVPLNELGESFLLSAFYHVRLQGAAGDLQPGREFLPDHGGPLNSYIQPPEL